MTVETYGLSGRLMEDFEVPCWHLFVEVSESKHFHQRFGLREVDPDEALNVQVQELLSGGERNGKFEIFRRYEEEPGHAAIMEWFQYD
jgi:hypothetical protein